MINAIIFIVAMVILGVVIDIRRTQLAMSKTLERINDTLNHVAEYADHNNEKEANTIRAINEMCQALNQSFSANNAFMNHTSYAIQNIVVCMIPFVDDIKQRAVANEDYEKAQECVNLINNLREIIKRTNND